MSSISNFNFISIAHADNPVATPGAPVTASTAQAQTPTAVAAPGQPSFLSMATLFLPMFLVMYFLIIRPQQKKQKEHISRLEKLQYGDEIVTQGGVFGKITGMTDKVLTVEIAEGVKIKMLKSQVASINPQLNGPEKTA